MILLWSLLLVPILSQIVWVGDTRTAQTPAIIGVIQDIPKGINLIKVPIESQPMFPLEFCHEFGALARPFDDLHPEMQIMFNFSTRRKEAWEIAHVEL
jgi:hypothetical protein